MGSPAAAGLSSLAAPPPVGIVQDSFHSSPWHRASFRLLERRLPLGQQQQGCVPLLAQGGLSASSCAGRSVWMALHSPCPGWPLSSRITPLRTYASGHPIATADAEEATSVVSALEAALGTPLSTAPSLPPQEALVVVISGPSGVGKDAVIQRLQQMRPSLHFVVTATSRPMRPGEVHGKDYFFVNREEFEAMVRQEELLEHAVVYGEYKGIPKQQVRDALLRGTDVVLRLDVQGAATVRRLLGGGGVFVFLVAESEAALVRRLVARKTEPMDRLKVRVATARQEQARLEEFDYVVVNEDGCLDRTVQQLCAIIDAEKARVARSPAKL